MTAHLITIFVAGLVGGILNAYLSDNGFLIPKKVQVDGRLIYRPGFLGNAIVGGAASILSWGLYGPYAAYPLFGGTAAVPLPEGGPALAAVAGAALVGVGGARWISNEADKRLLRAAASHAAAGESDPRKATKIMVASPAEALELALH